MTIYCILWRGRTWIWLYFNESEHELGNNSGKLSWGKSLCNVEYVSKWVQLKNQTLDFTVKEERKKEIHFKIRKKNMKKGKKEKWFATETKSYMKCGDKTTWKKEYNYFIPCFKTQTKCRIILLKVSLAPFLTEGLASHVQAKKISQGLFWFGCNLGQLIAYS